MSRLALVRTILVLKSLALWLVIAVAGPFIVAAKCLGLSARAAWCISRDQIVYDWREEAAHFRKWRQAFHYTWRGEPIPRAATPGDEFIGAYRIDRFGVKVYDPSAVPGEVVRQEPYDLGGNIQH